MFIRKKRNASGSITIQIVSKIGRSNKVVQTIGTGRSEQQIEFLLQRARQFIYDQKSIPSLFVSKEDAFIEAYLEGVSNAQVQVIGPELIFGRLFDSIGFNQVNDELFRHLVITRLYHPGSKLKTIDYLYRFLGVTKKVDEIYRFLDRLNARIKEQVEQISFDYTKRVLGGSITIVFYDMTTLHFEASDEDDLRKTGFSKAGKHQNPQIFLGLLVGLDGFAIGYDIFEGNIFEGHTLIPTLEKFSKRFSLGKPIVIADAGLLSNDNIKLLQENEYQFIIGARIKNESTAIKGAILEEEWVDRKAIAFNKNDKTKLIVAYSEKRATKDRHNRERGLKRLEKNVKSGKLSKSNINNKGYNKYLKLIGAIEVKINYQKFEEDGAWDGLKGYITNARLTAGQVIENYNHLWQIEKAFRVSKTDLQIRPIYHRLKHRIEGHICISFVAYAVYKELERILRQEESNITVKRAADLTHNIYRLNVIMPESKEHKAVLLKMDPEQTELYSIILKNT